MGNTTTSGRYDPALLRGRDVPRGAGHSATRASARAPHAGPGETRDNVTVTRLAPSSRYAFFVNIDRGAYEKPFQLTSDEAIAIAALVLPHYPPEEVLALFRGLPQFQRRALHDGPDALTTAATAATAARDAVVRDDDPPSPARDV